MKNIRLFFIALLGLVCASLPAVAENSRVPMPEITKGKGEQCVRPADDMRKNHMHYLSHKRDKTLREGVRTKEFSLKECIACHAKKDDAGQFVSITDEGQFCQSCHSYASVKLDCFECHATKPQQGSHDMSHSHNNNDSVLLNKLVQNQNTTDN